MNKGIREVANITVKKLSGRGDENYWITCDAM